jgi:hypothetical protein
VYVCESSSSWLDDTHRHTHIGSNMFRTSNVASDVQREQGYTHAVLETAGKGGLPQEARTDVFERDAWGGGCTQFCGVPVNLSKSSVSQCLFHLVAFSVMRWGMWGVGFRA